jgi:biotin synthase
MHPALLLPATTALGTLEADGRERGILAGANVVMPNLSPASVRGKYELYDGKASSGSESAQCLALLSERMRAIGYRVVVDRGEPRAVPAATAVPAPAAAPDASATPDAPAAPTTSSV